MRNHLGKIVIGFCLVLASITMNVNESPSLCFPENDLYISVDQKSRTAMNEAVFNKVIDTVEDLYAPIIADLGGELLIERKWTDGTVNAYAQRIGNTYKVVMFGGLARHELITNEGFALVVCHELGHHLGGTPKKTSWYGGLIWAANEGQADYWGTTKCMKKVLEVLPEELYVEADADYNYALKKCENVYDGNERDICVRSAMAGKSLAELLNALGSSSKPVHFFTPDTKIVSTTSHTHPAAQCRMDTYLAGSICDKSADDVVSETDEAQGVCYVEGIHTEKERPLCWFKPKK